MRGEGGKGTAAEAGGDGDPGIRAKTDSGAELGSDIHAEAGSGREPGIGADENPGGASGNGPVPTSGADSSPTSNPTSSGTSGRTAPAALPGLSATPKLAPFRFAGAVAVVTGAAGGMGEQLAYGLAAKGSHLVLVDRDAERLKSVAETVSRRRPEIRVRTLVADLSEADAVARVAAEVLAAEPVLNLLINNAGVALAGTFEQTSAEEFDWVMAINFAAPVALTRALLPRLRESAGSHVVNTSSLFGLIAPPGQSAYSASKFALRGFTEALRHELAGEVGVTCVHPGGIKTRIALDARVASGADQQQSEKAMRAFTKVLTYPADRAAARILDGVRRRRGRVLIALSARVPDVLARLFPATYWELFVRLRPGAGRGK